MNLMLPTVLSDKLSGHDYTAVDVAAVVVTGISVVFIGLVLLVMFVVAYGAIFRKIDKNKQKKAEMKKAEETANAPKTEVKAVPAAPVVSDGVEEEIVAVITAAINAMSSESGKTMKIKSIKRASSAQRNAWASAGLAENTRAF